jgi:hypothetical protein
MMCEQRGDGNAQGNDSERKEHGKPSLHTVTPQREFLDVIELQRRI